MTKQVVELNRVFVDGVKEQFCWDVWAYSRENAGSLDSERATGFLKERINQAFAVLEKKLDKMASDLDRKRDEIIELKSWVRIKDLLPAHEETVLVFNGKHVVMAQYDEDSDCFWPATKPEYRYQWNAWKDAELVGDVAVEKVTHWYRIRKTPKKMYSESF